MACENCTCGKDKSTAAGATAVKGCNSGGCASGGCNRLNTFDWLSDIQVAARNDFDMIEVTFKNGSRKGFYHCPPHVKIEKNDLVILDVGQGYDVGKVSLTGELARIQFKRKRMSEKALYTDVLRKAHDRDLEKLHDLRRLETEVRVKARIISSSLGLDMKIGDVEFQGDGRKITFYYTAEGRVDFRELLKHFASEFKVKIEMRQIGARQESARIGGIGSCGRELCCSTWLTDFKSVSTGAARYQNLALNQTKLSGQCGRLKCCLNYELDTYLDALRSFPKRVDRLDTEAGLAILLKTDVFRGIMYYTYKDPMMMKVYALTKENVRAIQEMNAAGKKPADLASLEIVAVEGMDELDFDSNVTGEIELAPMSKNKKKRRRPSNSSNRDTNAKTQAEGTEEGNTTNPPRNNNRQQQGNDRRDNRSGRDTRRPPRNESDGTNPNSAEPKKFARPESDRRQSGEPRPPRDDNNRGNRRRHPGRNNNPNADGGNTPPTPPPPPVE